MLLREKGIPGLLCSYEHNNLSVGEAPTSIPIRAQDDCGTRVPNAPVRRMRPIRVQPGVGYPESGALSGGRKLKRVRCALPDAHRLAQRPGNGLAQRGAGTHEPAGASESGIGLVEAFRQPQEAQARRDQAGSGCRAAAAQEEAPGAG
jgi:hypothetical protein